MRRKFVSACLGIAIATSGVLAFASGAYASHAPEIKRGGNVTVVVVAQQFLDLDPAHNQNDTTDEVEMNAIFGGIFYQTTTDGIGLGFASGYHFSDGNQELTITIRPGLKFTDGTPLNASAVAYNINRDLLPANGCQCASSFLPVTGVTSHGSNVVITMSKPYAPILQAFIDNAPDWPASPTAIASTTANAFATDPIGAGPFEVKSFSPSAQIVVTKNPHYYIKGEPYLNSITYITTPVDQSAFSALQAGNAQMELGITTGSIYSQAKADPAQFQVLLKPGTIATDLELNTYKPPFNNIVAREAVAAALNPHQLLNIVSPGFGNVVEDDQAPGGAYYERKVPGYQGYNLARAKQLVQQLGGLSFSIQGSNSSAGELLLAAQQSELEAAGMTVSIVPETITVEIVNLPDGNFEGIDASAGGADPDVGSNSLTSRFQTNGLYTCCHDPALDGLINKTSQLASPAARQKAFDNVYAYVAKNVLNVPLYALPDDIIITKSLHNVEISPTGGSLTTIINWPQVWMS